MRKDNANVNRGKKRKTKPVKTQLFEVNNVEYNWIFVHECFHKWSGVGNVILDYHKFVSANVGKIGFLYMNAFVGGLVGYILEMCFEIIVNLCFCLDYTLALEGIFYLFFYFFITFIDYFIFI